MHSQPQVKAVNARSLNVLHRDQVLSKVGSARSGLHDSARDEDVDPHYYGITNLKIMKMNANKGTPGASSIFDIGDQPAGSRVESMARYNHDEDTPEARNNKSIEKLKRNSLREKTQLSRKRPKRTINEGNNDLNFTV